MSKRRVPSWPMIVLVAIILVLMPIATSAQQQSTPSVRDCTGVTFPYTMTGNTPAELVTAIECANANGTADVIDLNGQTVTLTAVYASYSGDTGLPQITSTVTLQDGTITRSGDTAFRLLGVDGTGNLALNTVTLSNGNGAIDSGGAVFNNFGTLTVLNSTITGNSAASFGGAIANTGTLTVTTSTISGNDIGSFGGAISTTGTATITNSLITGNAATYGGGIYNDGNLTLINSTLAGNYADNTAGSVFNGDSLLLQNTVSYGNEATTTNEISGAYTATNSLIGVDPLFVAPLDASDNAPTIAGDYRLGTGSPAINAGDNALVPIDLTTDLDSNPRIVDGTVDIGAYEVQPVNLLANPGFEAGTAPWEVVSLGNDKVKDTNPYEGTFAFRFKGFAGKTSGKAKQTVDTPPISDGESFVLTAQINSGASAVGKVILKANTDLGNKFKVKLAFDQAGAYSLHEVVAPVTLAVGETVTKVTVIFNDKSQSGKVYVDAVSLTIEPTAARTVTRSDVLPPPAAPSGFRGGN